MSGLGTIRFFFCLEKNISKYENVLVLLKCKTQTCKNAINPMIFEIFKEKYATTMMWYQLIENDIKLIFAYMREGGVEENLSDVESTTLGTMIRKLEKLDYSDGKPFISKGDYEFLRGICEKRNYWAHSAFTDFAYIKNPFSSKEYCEVCKTLEKDCREVERASSILEKMRLEYCGSVR